MRFRHFDSDIYRNARQQLFLKALKQQISSQLGIDTVLQIANAIEHNVVVGRGGNKPLDVKTLKDYLFFARRLPSGHVFQSRIAGPYRLHRADPTSSNDHRGRGSRLRQSGREVAREGARRRVRDQAPLERAAPAGRRRRQS